MADEGQDNVEFLEGVGEVGLGVDTETLDLVLMVKTPIGIVRVSQTKERALQLGIALIRYSGQRFRKPPVVPPETRQKEVADAKDSGNRRDPDWPDLDGHGSSGEQADRAR